jgi:hypothetical protein
MLFSVELAEIFFVDTTPFVQSYFTDAEGHNYDWRGIGSPRAYIANLIKVFMLIIVSLSKQCIKFTALATQLQAYDQLCK